MTTSNFIDLAPGFFAAWGGWLSEKRSAGWSPAATSPQTSFHSF